MAKFLYSRNKKGRNIWLRHGASYFRWEILVKKLSFLHPCLDSKIPRIGGVALIGGLVGWPETPEKIPLTLIMSLSTQFLNENAGFDLPVNHYVSVFTYYSKDDYFLEYITYHGIQNELDNIRKGYTKVVFHAEGNEVAGPITIPAMAIEIDSVDPCDAEFQESKIGGQPDYLQNEFLSLGNEKFALQLYGSDFPAPYTDIFFLPEALGYIFIDENRTLASSISDAGTFFIQVT